MSTKNNKLKQILRDTQIATITVRKIKDADVETFYNGSRTRFVNYNWYKAMVGQLLDENQELLNKLNS